MNLAMPVFPPKLLTTLRSYDRRQFVDLTAGAIVGIVALRRDRRKKLPRVTKITALHIRKGPYAE